jgi:hypothetical protein
MLVTPEYKVGSKEWAFLNGEDLAWAPGEREKIQQKIIADRVNARESAFHQWVGGEEGQALMQKYGIDPVIYNNDGDEFKWTGSGYQKTMKVDDHASFSDYVKVVLKSVVTAAVTAGAGTVLGGALQGTTLGANIGKAAASVNSALAKALAAVPGINPANATSIANFFFPPTSVGGMLGTGAQADPWGLISGFGGAAAGGAAGSSGYNEITEAVNAAMSSNVIVNLTQGVNGSEDGVGTDDTNNQSETQRYYPGNLPAGYIYDKAKGAVINQSTGAEYPVTKYSNVPGVAPYSWYVDIPDNEDTDGGGGGGSTSTSSSSSPGSEGGGTQDPDGTTSPQAATDEIYEPGDGEFANTTDNQTPWWIVRDGKVYVLTVLNPDAPMDELQSGYVLTNDYPEHINPDQDSEWDDRGILITEIEDFDAPIPPFADWSLYCTIYPDSKVCAFTGSVTGGGNPDSGSASGGGDESDVGDDDDDGDDQSDGDDDDSDATSTTTGTTISTTPGPGLDITGIDPWGGQGIGGGDGGGDGPYGSGDGSGGGDGTGTGGGSGSGNGLGGGTLDLTGRGYWDNEWTKLPQGHVFQPYVKRKPKVGGPQHKPKTKIIRDDIYKNLWKDLMS